MKDFNISNELEKSNTTKSSEKRSSSPSRREKEKIRTIPYEKYKKLVKIFISIIIILIIMFIIIICCLYFLVFKKKDETNQEKIIHTYSFINNSTKMDVPNVNENIIDDKSNGNGNANNENYGNNLECPSGSFISNDNKSCKKCTIDNCKKCYGINDYDVCTSCFSDYTPIYENNKIVSCNKNDKLEDNDKCLIYDSINNQCSKCETGYKLIDGKCLLNYSMKTIYNTKIMNSQIQLINDTFVENIQEMIIDDVIVTPCNNYFFSSIGNHTVYFLMKNNIKSLARMFFNIQNIISISFTSLFDSESVKSLNLMFYNCTKLTSADFHYFNTKNVVNMTALFYGCYSLSSMKIDNFNTENVQNMGDMFCDCLSLTSIDLSHFNTKNARTMPFLFSGCHNLISVNVSTFNTQNVIRLEGMFESCSSLKSINISNFDTQNAQHMYYMFHNCSSLTSLDLHNFNTKNVLDMEKIFAYCPKLKYLDISNFQYNDTEFSYYPHRYNNIFFGLPSSLDIIIGKNFYNKLKDQIPDTWNKMVINN